MHHRSVDIGWTNHDRFTIKTVNPIVVIKCSKFQFFESRVDKKNYVIVLSRYYSTMSLAVTHSRWLLCYMLQYRPIDETNSNKSFCGRDLNEKTFKHHCWWSNNEPCGAVNLDGLYKISSEISDCFISETIYFISSNTHYVPVQWIYNLTNTLCQYNIAHII